MQVIYKDCEIQFLEQKDFRLKNQVNIIHLQKM